VRGVRLSDAERARTRVMLVDARNRVSASSGPGTAAGETFDLKTDGRDSGTCRLPAPPASTGPPATETYARLGWYGVLVQA